LKKRKKKLNFYFFSIIFSIFFFKEIKRIINRSLVIIINKIKINNNSSSLHIKIIKENIADLEVEAEVVIAIIAEGQVGQEVLEVEVMKILK
jgi:hypothetical protein